MTRSAGSSGLARLGSPPMAARASRMAARSTTQGTPVKSCNRTRAGAKEISFMPAGRHEADLCDAGAVTARHGGHISRGNALAIFVAQQILQQNPDGEGQAPNVPDTLPGKMRETEIVVIHGADAQFRRGAKAIFCHWFDYKACQEYAANRGQTRLSQAAVFAARGGYPLGAGLSPVSLTRKPLQRRVPENV